MGVKVTSFRMPRKTLEYSEVSSVAFTPRVSVMLWLVSGVYLLYSPVKNWKDRKITSRVLIHLSA